MVSTRSSRRPGWTMIEVLVVIAIIAVVVGLLLVAIQQVREQAGKVQCANNLHNLGVALQNYHINKKEFPTEAGENPSVFKQLLPFVEQQNANDATPVKEYLCGGRRTTAVGAKRDYGYSASMAIGAKGPSVLDALDPVSISYISAFKGASETALLSHVWMAPTNYFNGADPTDKGWAQKENGRQNAGIVKEDRDRTANTSYLGGPHTRVLPTLFADGRVDQIAYSSTYDWPTAWAYSTSFSRDCTSWQDPAAPSRKACSGCGDTCGCGCLPPSVYIVAQLREKSKSGKLTPEEEALLKDLDKSSYDKYKERLKKEREDWEKSVREKAESGQPLTPEEKQYYDSYTQKKEQDRLYQEQQKENTRIYNEKVSKEKSIIDKLKKGESLTEEEQKWYDRYSEGKEKFTNDQQKRDWEKYVKEKGDKNGGDSLTGKEKTEYDRQVKKAADDKAYAEKKQWEKDTVAKGKSGAELTPEEKKYYDQYETTRIETEKAAAKKAADDKAYQESIAKKNEAINKGKSGEPLDADQQKIYDDYKAQQAADAAKAAADKQAADNALQKRLDDYASKMNGPQSSGPGTSCGCGFSCCAPGTCKCSH